MYVFCFRCGRKPDMAFSLSFMGLFEGTFMQNLREKQSFEEQDHMYASANFSSILQPIRNDMCC
jgi:hypothetical protein